MVELAKMIGAGSSATDAKIALREIINRAFRAIRSPRPARNATSSFGSARRDLISGPRE
jgi:hypothetical protein